VPIDLVASKSAVCITKAGLPCEEIVNLAAEAGPTKGRAAFDRDPVCVTHTPEPTERTKVDAEVVHWLDLTCPGCRDRHRRVAADGTPSYSLSTLTDSFLKFDVVFHVIHNTAGKGWLELWQLQAQLDVLNSAFSGANDPLSIDSQVRFNMKHYQYIESDQYVANCKGKSSAFRSVYSWGSSAVINIFTCPATGFLGWAYLPWLYPDG
jgi:hypothetical protein